MLTSCCSHTLTLSVHSVSDEMYVPYTTRKFSSQSIHAYFVNIPCFQLYTSSCSPILIVMKKHPKTETANFCFLSSTGGVLKWLQECKTTERG